jgi:hypothetical protein
MRSDRGLNPQGIESIKSDSEVRKKTAKTWRTVFYGVMMMMSISCR